MSYEARFPLALATWRVVATATPRLRRPCGGCRAQVWLESTERFRVNAQKRRLDVWLIYRCPGCGRRTNVDVHARTSPRALGPALDAYLRNDPEAARRVAFTVAAARRPADPEVPFVVERPAWSEGRDLRVRLELTEPFSVPLARVLGLALDATAG